MCNTFYWKNVQVSKEGVGHWGEDKAAEMREGNDKENCTLIISDRMARGILV